MSANGSTTNDPLDQITTAVKAARRAQTNIEIAVGRALHDGANWTQIADALGVSRQSAHQRYRRLRYDPVNHRAWHEPPLPI